MPVARALGIVKRALDDKLHADGNMTPTRFLSCPRNIIIKDRFSVYLDPRADESAYEGSLEHDDLQRNAPPGTYTEIQFPIEGRPQPMFLGVPIRGKLDFLCADFSGIDDYKTHGFKSAHYKAKRVEPDEEDVVQLNIYRLCVEQALEIDTSKMKLRLWHKLKGAQGRALPDRLDVHNYVHEDNMFKTPMRTAWFSRDVPIRNEAWIASVKPKGARFTVGEIFDMYRYFHKRVSEGATYEEAIAAIPMVGETMLYGQQCPIYCSPGVRDKCFELAGRRPMFGGLDPAFD